MLTTHIVAALCSAVRSGNVLLFDDVVVVVNSISADKCILHVLPTCVRPQTTALYIYYGSQQAHKHKHTH